jgi:hypothetical protein
VPALVAVTALVALNALTALVAEVAVFAVLADSAVVAVVADPAEVAKLALGTAPVTFAPGILFNPLAFPTNLPDTETLLAVILPDTLREVNVPTDVMLG